MPAHPTNPPDHRPISKKGPALLFVCLALNLIYLGCSALAGQQFKTHAARGDYEWIAARQIDCNEVSHRCGQLHLIKGDACFRLAESDRQPADNYACAADELAQGLALKPSWEDMADQFEKREQLCESLGNLQELQSGAAAGETADRLMEAAKTFYRLVPENVPAVYYLSLARLKRLEPRLAAVNAADRFPVCTQLKRTVTQVLTLMNTADRQTLPDWDRFAERYQRLAFELGAAMHTAGCR